jgi:serine/threonine-protein kinase
MVSGRKPFYGERAELLDAHLHQAPPRPSEFAYVSPELEAIILKAIAKDPAQRYQSGAELVEALDGVQLVPPPEQVALPQRILNWFRGSPAPA